MNSKSIQILNISEFRLKGIALFVLLLYKSPVTPAAIMKPVSTTTPPVQAGTTTLTINNKRVYDFYTANPHINIESMNLVLLDLIEQLHNDISKLSAATATGEILACVREIHTNMTSLGDTLAFKLHDHNKSFVETTKLVIGMASSENTDKIIQALNRNTDSFIERIHSSIPKMNDESNRKIQQLLSDVQLAMQSDIRAVLEAT